MVSISKDPLYKITRWYMGQKEMNFYLSSCIEYYGSVPDGIQEALLKYWKTRSPKYAQTTLLCNCCRWICREAKERLTRKRGSIQRMFLQHGPTRMWYEQDWPKEVPVQELEKAIDSLSARERHVIRIRFGIGRNGLRSTPLTLNQAGVAMGVTRERVRQIEWRALKALRRKLVGTAAYTWAVDNGLDLWETEV